MTAAHMLTVRVWQVRDKIQEYNAKGSPVAAAIVEPIQGEGGDRYATPYFFQQLQTILKQVRQLFIHRQLRCKCDFSDKLVDVN